MKYAVVIEKGENSYGAHVPDLPGCVAVGETREEVLRLIESENRRAQLGSPDHLSAIAALWEEQGRGRHR